MIRSVVRSLLAVVACLALCLSLVPAADAIESDPQCRWVAYVYLYCTSSGYPTYNVAIGDTEYACIQTRNHYINNPNSGCTVVGWDPCEPNRYCPVKADEELEPADPGF